MNFGEALSLNALEFLGAIGLLLLFAYAILKKK